MPPKTISPEKLEAFIEKLKAKQYPEASEILDELIAENPTSSSLHFYQALIHYETGQPEEGGKMLENVKDPTAQWFRMGVLAVQRKFQSDRCIFYFDEVLKRNGKIAAAWFNKGLVLEKIGRLEEARSCYQNISLPREILIRGLLPLGVLGLSVYAIIGASSGWWFPQGNFWGTIAVFFFLLVAFSATRAIFTGVKTIRMLYQKIYGKLSKESEPPEA